MRRRRALLGLAGGAVTGLAALDAVDRRRIAADPVRPLLEEHPAGGVDAEATSADGTRLHVELFGPEDAPPVVLVHGWTCAIRFWRRQIRDLMDDHRVIAYDLRGHGESGTPKAANWSPDALADDLHAVLEQCLPGGRPALLAGHSLGAMTIVAWAGRHPEAVRERATAAALVNTGIGDLISESLVVRTPSAFAKPQEVLGTLVLGAAAPLPKRPDPITHRAVRHIALSKSASPAEVRFCEGLVLDTPPRVRAACGKELSRLDLRERVEHLTVPTLVVTASADRLTPPKHAKDLAETLPDCAGLVELDGAGHMGPVERSDEVSAAIRDLAAKHAASGAVATSRP